MGVFFSGSVASVLMEYAAGGTLAGMIKAAAQERAPFVSARVRRWTRQLALGLQYVHEQHVIHRDVTSANILLGDEDAIKITDFGWSTLNTQMATTFAGTPCALRACLLPHPPPAPPSVRAPRAHTDPAHTAHTRQPPPTPTHLLTLTLTLTLIFTCRTPHHTTLTLARPPSILGSLPDLHASAPLHHRH